MHSGKGVLWAMAKSSTTWLGEVFEGLETHVNKRAHPDTAELCSSIGCCERHELTNVQHMDLAHVHALRLQMFTCMPT